MSPWIAAAVGFVMGMAITFYGGARLVLVAAKQNVEKDIEIQRTANQARELHAHLAHALRMLRHARAKGPVALGMLGLGSDASKDEARRAGRLLVRKAHPDHGGDADVLRLVLAVKDAAEKEARS